MKPNPIRILIISEFFFEETTGGGLLLKNLFKNYPKKNIFIIHNDLKFKDNDYPFTYCLKKTNKTKNLLKKILGLSFYNQLIRLRNFLGKKKKIYVEFNLANEISDFRPQIIYTFLGDYVLMKFIKDIREKMNIPIIVHFMDNWIAKYEKEYSVESKLFNYFVRTSESVVAINKKMSSVYSQKYKRKFTVLHNGLDKKKIRKPIVTEKKKILYIGSIYQNSQLESLVEIAEAVYQISKKNDNISFNLYLPNEQKLLFNKYFPKSKSILILDHNLNDESYFEIISKSSLLILASNFDSESIDYYKFSWPAKMPSYLMSKIPIFIYGPKKIFFVEDASKKLWAYTQTQKSKKKLEASINEIMYNKKLRNQVVKNALNVSKVFEIKNIQNKFYKLIKDQISK